MLKKLENEQKRMIKEWENVVPDKKQMNFSK